MADDFFTQVRNAARKRGVKGAEEDARKYFQRKVRELGKGITGDKLLKSRPDLLVNKGQISIGRMYVFAYDPKWKKELPYYDRFPLIFVLNGKGTKSGSGFLGINLHYLPPKRRALLLAKLTELASSKRYDEKTKLAISYKILSDSAKYKDFKPCVKQYLNAHVKSRFLMIPPEDWLPTVFLPIAQFEKASQQKVWADSRKKT